MPIDLSQFRSKSNIVDLSQFRTPSPAPAPIDFGALTDKELADFGTSRDALTKEVLNQQPSAQGTGVPKEATPTIPIQVPVGTPLPIQEPTPTIQIPVQMAPVDLSQFKQNQLPEFKPQGLNTPQDMLDLAAGSVHGVGQLGADVANISDFVFGTSFEPKVQTFLNSLAPISDPNSLAAQVGQALGQIGTFAAGGTAIKGGATLLNLGPTGLKIAETLGLNVLGITSGVSQGISDVEEAPDATNMQKGLVIAANAGLGALDAFPIGRTLDRLGGAGLDKPASSLISKLIGQRNAVGIRSALEGAIEEGIQEAIQTSGQDAAAKFVLGLERDIKSDTYQAGKVGAIASGIVNFLGGRRAFLQREYGFTDGDIQTLRDVETERANEDNRRIQEEVQRALISPEIGNYSENLAKVITRPPVQRGKAEELAESIKLPSGQTIEDTLNQDIQPFTQHMASPEFGLRNDPERAQIAGSIVEAQLKQRFYSDLGYMANDRLKAGLSKQQRLQVRKLMNEVYTNKNTNIDALADSDPKVYAAVKGMQTEFENYKTRFINHKVNVFKELLPSNERIALERVLAGESIDSAVRDEKVDKADLTEILDSLAETQNWGLKDYITNIEPGTYKVVRKIKDEDTGKEHEQVVAVGATKGDAQRKALRYLAENRDVDSLFFDNTYRAAEPTSTRLSPKQLRLLHIKFAERYNAEIDAISEVSQEDLDRFGLKETPETIKEKLKGLVKPDYGRKPSAGPTQKRKGILEGELDLFDAFPTYIHQMEKLMNLEIPIMRAQKYLAANPDIEGVNKNKNDVIREQIEYTLGKRQKSDDILDGWMDGLNRLSQDGLGRFIRKIPGVDSEPGRASRLISKVRQLQAYKKLAYRPTAAFINYTGGLQHVYVKTGIKYLNEGRSLYSSKEGKQILREEAPYLGIDSSVDFKGGLQAGQGGPLRLAKPLGLFQEAEIQPREIGYLANYQMAKKEYNMDEDAAREYARKAIRTQLFVYNSAALPHVLRTNTGRLTGQFKTYMFKEIEFFKGLSRKERARYIGSVVALGGPRALVRTMQSIPIIALLVGLAEKEMEGFFNDPGDTPASKTMHQLAAGGLPGLANVDLSRQYAPQLFSSDPSAVAGPFISDTINLWNYVADPIIRGNMTEAYMGTKDYARKTILPLNNWAKFWEGLTYGNKLRDKDGKPIAPLDSTWDKAQLILGSTPLDIGQAEGRSRMALNEAYNNARERAAAARFIRKQLFVKQENIDSLIDKLIMKKYVDTGGTRAGIEDAAPAFFTDVELRTLLGMPEAERVNAIDTLNIDLYATNLLERARGRLNVDQTPLR